MKRNDTVESNDKEQKKQSWYSKLPYKKRKTLWGIIFLLPWLIGLIMFFIGPMMNTIYYSFNDITLDVKGLQFSFSGLSNFKHALFVDAKFTKELVTSLGEAILNVPIMIFVSLFVAMLLNGEYKGRGFFRLIFFIPIILATGITNMEMSNLKISIVEESSKSVINTQFLTSMFVESGIPEEIIQFLNKFVGSIFDVITTSGIQMLIFLSGLQAITPSLYEVAKIEGATAYEAFCKITLPMISPMILVCMVYSLADTFSNSKISDTIYNVTFTNGTYGLGASMSIIYLIVTIAIIGIASFIVSRGVFYYDK